MSKLSELLPAGASGKTIEAVATANIASKAPVILNSAGTVTQVAASPTTQTIPATGSNKVLYWEAGHLRALLITRICQHIPQIPLRVLFSLHRHPQGTPEY